MNDEKVRDEEDKEIEQIVVGYEDWQEKLAEWACAVVGNEGDERGFGDGGSGKGSTSLVIFSIVLILNYESLLV